ncbi:MAG: response regulator, partial [Nitrospira sp.]|nr:response regulator [Nitrospira sp.]
MPDKAKILVVDDDARNILILSERLKASGYEVVAAHDGQEALERARNENPDLILMDGVMPGMDGFEACRRLKVDKDAPFIPIIMLTAQAETKDVVKGLEQGADEYVTKPFNPVELMARVRSMLRIKRIHDDLQRATVQLVQSEKMASLGLLIAGVAHELNNPITFIKANVNPLKEYVKSLIDIIEKYDELLGKGVEREEILSEIARFKEEVELAFKLADLDDLLNSIRTGAERAAVFVRDLRNFSRLEEEEVKLADLHEGIESSLSLLRHLCKDRIEVRREYSQVPLVECYPGLLNQVFMNLLANAAHAIEG